MKQMMTKDKIIEGKNGNITTKIIIPTHHPLVEKIMEDMKPIFKRLLEEKPKNGKRVNKYKEGERYILDSFERLTLLDKRERQVIESIRYLAERPSKVLLKRYKSSHKEFIEYHYDTLLNFYISYSECVYQCVNQILNLGISERSVSASLLKKNKWVKEAGLHKYVGDLDKLRNRHSLDRNQTTHQGRSKDIDELHQYLQFDFFAEAPFPPKNLRPTLEDHKKIRRPLYKWHAKEFLDPIKSDFGESMNVNENLLNDLIPYYEFWTGTAKEFASRACIHTVDI